MLKAIKILALLACLQLLALPALEAEEKDVDAEVRAILADVPLIDGHNDAPWAIRSQTANHLDTLDFSDTTGLDEPMHTDLQRLRRGGVGGQFWSVWVPTSLQGGEAVIAVFEQIDLVHRLVERSPDDLELALTAADIRRIHADGRIASLIGVEGGHSMGDSLAVLRQLFAAGARYMTLTHWSGVAWADSATDAPKSDGLSPFGEVVIREMNRLGMMVDLAHVSAAAMHDALNVSRAPVIFSHSNAYAINPHPRNVPDDVLERVRDTGSIVMVNFGSFFVAHSQVQRWAEEEAERARLKVLHPGDPELVEKAMDEWQEANPRPKVSLGELADHVDHIRKVAGIDHIGLGSDFDGIEALPEGIDDVSAYPALLAELMNRGYTRDDIAKIAGLNFLRVMEQAEAVARELQASEPPYDALLDEIDRTTPD